MAKPMQLDDGKGNKVSTSNVHIFNGTLELIQSERTRIRDTEGNGKPSAAVVIDRMWQVYAQSIKPASKDEASDNNDGVIKFTNNHHDPLFEILGRLLQTKKGAHVEALLRWADQVQDQEPDESPIENKPDFVAEGREKMRVANEKIARLREGLSRTPPTDDRDEPAVQSGDQGPNSKRRKRAG